MQNVATLHSEIARRNIRGGVAFRMPHVQPRAGGVWKHIEDVIFLDRLGRHIAMAHGKGMLRRRGVAGVKGTKCLLRLPVLLPAGLDQVKRILSPHL